MDTTSKLVSMANQIADFFGVQSADPTPAVAAVARHITENWDPRMRAGIRAHVEAGGAGLQPIALEAVKRLAA